MVLFSALTLVGFHELGVPVYLALLLTIGTMILLAFAIERLVLRPMINQPDIILFMATIGLTFFLEGFGQMLWRSEEHTSELQSLMRISYAVFCLKKKNTLNRTLPPYLPPHMPKRHRH